MLGFRVAFFCLLTRWLHYFLRLRKVFAKYIYNIPSFVTDVVCSGALRAMIPVGYVCFSSLGCIIDSGVNDTDIDEQCIQELCCNVGVALHLTGVCIYQPFMLRPFHKLTMTEVLQFKLPLEDKVTVILLALSSACSMSLFAWRTFDGWTKPGVMFSVIGSDMLVIILIWSYVFGAATKNVLKREGHGKYEGEEGADGEGVAGGEENAVGLATGEMGLGGLAPGLV